MLFYEFMKYLPTWVIFRDGYGFSGAGVARQKIRAASAGDFSFVMFFA
jgi:hypothetical protein